MVHDDTKNAPKRAKIYTCICCDYKCSKMSDIHRHELTAKHKNNEEGYKMVQKSAKKAPKIEGLNVHLCNCGKEYKHHSGLSRHKIKCNAQTKILDNTTDKDLIMLLIKENSELKNMVLDVCQKIQPLNNTVNLNNVNSHNKTFNLNLFLNETCKDAMNIMDFVDSIKLQLSDLERVGEIGYIEGISNIIIKNLKELDVSQRPVHCTDKKRETMYIKDEDKWEKDEEQKKMHKVVRNVAAKNARLVLKYKELHPDCNTYHSKLSEKYNKIIIEAMGGSGDNDFEKEEKIIKNISKQIGIEKE